MNNKEMSDFRHLLENVDRSYDGFIHAVISYIKMPGNEYKKEIIEDYIRSVSQVSSSDVLKFMVENTDFFVGSNKQMQEAM